MIEIKCRKAMDGCRPKSNELEWNFNGKKILIDIPYDVRYIVSERLEKVVVEIFEIREIQLIGYGGEICSKLEIPDVEGYQFRGINKNTSSITGVSLLYFPVAEDAGNEWNDIEQYEFIVAECIKGKKLGIHR